MVRVGGPRVSHGTITVNSVRVVTVISVGGGTAHPGLRRVRRGQTGGRVCSLRFVWVEPGPWPAPVGLFDNFNDYPKTSLSAHAERWRSSLQVQPAQRRTVKEKTRLSGVDQVDATDSDSRHPPCAV